MASQKPFNLGGFAWANWSEISKHAGAMQAFNRKIESAEKDRSQKRLKAIGIAIGRARLPKVAKQLLLTSLFESQMIVQTYVHPSLLRKTFGPSRPGASKPQPRRKGKPKRPGRR